VLYRLDGIEADRHMQSDCCLLPVFYMTGCFSCSLTTLLPFPGLIVPIVAYLHKKAPENRGL